VLAPSHWAHAQSLPFLDYDPKLAMSLLDQAGYPDPDGPGPKPRFTIQYKTSTKKDRIGVARLISRYLKAVGIEVVVTPFEWGTFFRDINKSHFQMYSLSWVGITEPDIFHYIFHSSQLPPRGANRGHYVNQAIDHLTEQARKTVDHSERKRIYGQIQRILSVELPYIPLWYENNVVAFRKNVVGYQLTPDASFSSLVQVKKL
jgi:peptide/nickel transport system substrate-binding protein